jgi:hypothetical protein
MKKTFAKKARAAVMGVARAFAAAAIAVLLAGAPLGAQPSFAPDAALLQFDDIALYAVGYAYRGQPERQLPLGWSGDMDEATGVVCQLIGVQDGRRALFLHCPWIGGTGISFQQYSVDLPQATRILIRGATALREGTADKSDGVIFRVIVNGQKLLEASRDDEVWQDFQLDITSRRGTRATIRFEVDPGPRNDPGWDHSLWGDRELVLEGFVPPVDAHPAPPPLSLSRVLSDPSSGVAPPSGFDGTNGTELSGDVARLSYEGPDGTLEYTWTKPSGSSDPFFGEITLTATMTGDAPVTVPLATSASVSWDGAAAPGTNVFQRSSGGVLLVRSLDVGGTAAQVRIKGSISGKSLSLLVTCDDPLVRVLDAGVWGPVLRRRRLSVPYYTGSAYLLEKENIFAGAFLDWTESAASRHDGTKATYDALTDGSRNRLRERAVFTAAWHLAEVLPNIPNPPSPYRGLLADRVVLDIWGGSYGSIAAHLDWLAEYGISRCAAIVHVWQRSGYDNALPAHIPANADLGGDVAMTYLVATGRRLGVPVALHENYVDYYPNYDFFDPIDISLDSAGEFVLGWFNPGTLIQAFAVKPNAMLRLAATQSPEIHSRYGTQADYLDVHSAVPPWFHVDFQAGETGAGRFSRVLEAHTELWAYERATHGGPVLGEGANHWYWSGLLDGVEAQFPWDPDGVATVYGGMSAPLGVDFDLLRIHPLQLNHGMGYHTRWWPDGFEEKLAGPPPMVVLDQYRMQEAAYGHAGFVDPGSFWHLPLVWLEHHLLSPVTARHATASPVEILYEVEGEWIDASAAARAGADASLDRVRVKYEGGLTITANGRADPLSVGAWTLPRFGWLAEGAGITAGTVLRGGIVADLADTGDSFFASARSASDWNLSTFRRIRPSVSSFQQTGARAFRASYRWEVEDRLAKDYRAFVHFTKDGEILWQQDHALSPPTTQWGPGQTIADGPYSISVPAAIADGDYDWLVGLFNVATGERVRLLGVDDGTSRIRLGGLRLGGGGATVSFEPETGTGEDPSPLYREHLNEAGSALDFGALRTDGSVLVSRSGDEWILRTLPRDRSFTLELSPGRFGRPETVRSTGGSASTVTPISAGARWRLPLNGASEYRWTSPAEVFRRGEANGDGNVDLSDAISVLGWLFLGAAAPPCPDSADANDDGGVDLSDAVYVLGWLFTGGPPPALPGAADCGPDPTADALAACAYPAGACGD